ncbi:Solute carrier family 22 member 3 [Chionoecetes opilio]|uniref:Solute carrier family 22 member 3 n=1 Tax=Chionoecetes opilio TaxID=41210 RepID=A0A8J4Y896_CHIOP|nr:Solute carrier family 22 member 3 [Chionoecetes opilio]
MVSCMSQGIVIDAFGRGRCAKICGTLFLVSAMLAACMPSLQLYLLFRGLVAVFEHYLYVACFVLSLELCTPSQRSLVGNLFAVPYALGYMALPGVALLVKDWRPLQLALSAPALFLLAYHWLLPESPRWLVTRGRLTEAADVLTQAAKVNGNPPLPRDRLMAALVAMHAKKENESRKKRNSVNRSDANTCHGVLPRRRVSQQGRKAWRWCGDVGNSVRSLVSTPRLVVVTLIVFYIWFTSPLPTMASLSTLST